MKTLKEFGVAAMVLLSVSVLSGCSVYSYSSVPETQTTYVNPQWAPPYSPGARYYYLPDIECYYDLSSHDFIILDHGRWFYTKSLVSIYPDFDLNDCFSIVLNINIYQPWMHHQYYVSHYPRYYYRDYYDHSNIPYVRGFNENSRSAVYWSENERHRARNWDNLNVKRGRNFKYTKPDRQEQNNWNNQSKQNEKREYTNFPNSQNNPRVTNSRSDNSYNKEPKNNQNNEVTKPGSENNTRNSQNGTTSGSRTTVNGTDNTSRQQPPANSEVTRRTDNTNYYGRTIGQPVKVEKQMRTQTVTRSAGKSTNNNSGSKNSQGRK